GTLDPAWDAVVRPQTREVAGELAATLRATQTFIDARGLGIRARSIADFDMPLYLVLKHPSGDVAALTTVLREHWTGIDRGRFFIHHNGNNLSLVPRFLGKERAVRHILQTHVGPEPVLTIGVGDSLTDGPFLALCDFALMPRDCPLALRALVPQ